MAWREKPEKKAVQRARLHRKRMPFPEVLLWQRLRRGLQAGFRIRRQHPVGSYIVDFACLRERLLIEIDGRSHDGRRVYDEARQRCLEAQGFVVIRFSNDEVMEDPDAVVQTIYQVLVRRRAERTGTDVPF